MSLSICTFTSAPGPMVASSLSLLREVADEILVCADSSVDDRDLYEYGRVADRLFRADFEFLEFHLPWLHEQCSGDWVLRLDGDECVSKALVEQLPGLTTARDALQYWIPRRWVHPDTTHWLAELPWWPDPQLRLVRNDVTLSFEGTLHSGARPTTPCGYLEAPIYHLAALVETEQARWRKANRYEALRPGLLASGGGPVNSMYLPERFASRKRRKVPVQDAQRLREVMEATYTSTTDRARGVVATAEWVSRAAFERRSPLRTLRAEERRARLAIVDPDVQLERMYAGEQRSVLISVRNDSDTEWPGGADRTPLVRIGVRWRTAAGKELPDEQRGMLPHAVRAGSTRVIGIPVRAPAEPGAYELELDVLLEEVAWFECGVRHAVSVTAPDARPILSANAALPDTLRHRRWHLRRHRIVIPRVLHQIWLGSVRLPPDLEAYRKTWAALNPRWEQRMWNDESVAREFPDLALDSARNMAERSDLVRYEIIRRFGGIYADTDVECLRPFDPLLAGVTAFAGIEVPGRLCNALIGAVPSHPAFEMAASQAPEMAGTGVYPFNTATTFLTYVLAQHSDVTVFPPEAFYPYLWNEPHRKGEHFPDAYAVHHWNRNWAGEADSSAPDGDTTE